MVIKGFLLSFLARKLLLNRHSATLTGVPAWLVWEPGTLNATGDDEVTLGLVPTFDPRSTPKPPDGDALCFALKPEPQVASRIQLGRASGNDLVLNDVTVSREHLALAFTPPEHWSVTAHVSTQPSRLAGVLLPADVPHTLLNGQVLEVGAQRLTFYGSAGFVERLERKLAK